MLLTSCKEKQKELISEDESTFNLKEDLYNFRQKMTVRDTIRIAFDHSICEYQGYEKLEITKSGDSLNIKSEYKDYNENNPNWKILYSKRIAIKDTIWNFLEFLKRNDSLMTDIPGDYYNLVIRHGNNKLSYSTNGLSQRLEFQHDYNQTMRNLFNPEGFIYGYTKEEIEIIKKELKQNKD